EDAEYALPLSRGEVLRRIYDLRLDFEDRGVPPAESERGPDSLEIKLPPDTRGDALAQLLRAVDAKVEVRDASGGGSELVLLSGSSYERRNLEADSVRAEFERLVVERLQRNEANPVHAPPLAFGTELRLGPTAVVAPISLTVPRDRVTISLARPASLAIAEIAPDGRWHLLYPARQEDERILPAGTHTLETTCAGVSTGDPFPPRAVVPACAVTRPVTPREVADGGVLPGSLAIIATDVTLRREVVRARVEGYSGYPYFSDPSYSPLVKAVRDSGGRRWAGIQTYLRR
ncbi:MAG TPA: hypothetical protein VFQ39_17905, partial [Longimicrobium sp.]|nr:hypothetical protein [Longimicrobium sp.]